MGSYTLPGGAWYSKDHCQFGISVLIDMHEDSDGSVVDKMGSRRIFKYMA